MLSEVLGIIDSLEATILESKKVPFSDKIILNEKEVLSLVDKVRIAIKAQGRMIRDEIEIMPNQAQNIAVSSPPSSQETTNSQLISQKEQEFELVKKEARSYAEDVLGGLHSMVAKMQYNLSRLETSLEHSRGAISGNNMNQKTGDKQ